MTVALYQFLHVTFSFNLYLAGFNMFVKNLEKM
jgi:hypothetical protein